MEDIFLDRPVEEKIIWAHKIYLKYKDQLHGDRQTAQLLKKLEQAIHDSRKEMAGAGIIDVCSICEREGGGSCCGAGLENKYSGRLLLINLLLGRPVPSKRNDPKSCFFLGENGCTLMARHVICVNYLCRTITERIEKERVDLLRGKEGIELENLFILNERIKALMGSLT